MTTPLFDHAIVGGGTAGCVLAHRLSADPRVRVLLIEAGIDTPEHDTPPDIATGLEPWLPRFAGDRYFWPGLTVSRVDDLPGFVRPRERYEQGRILGGGSSVNMTVANRGLPRDYDEWAALGAQGWDWTHVLPYFRKLEHDLQFGVSDPVRHGRDGPIPIDRVDRRHWTAFTNAVAHALEADGLNHLDDQNGTDVDGYFSPAFTARNGRRVSAAHAYLDASTRARANLTLWTGAHATRLLVDGATVYGVEVRRGDITQTVHAAEVIVAAGALQSPALLLRAGIGPAAQLQALQIPVVADRPGVGQNLWDHASLAVAAPLPGSAAADAASAPGAHPHQIGARLSSGVDPATPSDLFLHVGANPALGLVSSVFWINKPNSRGALHLDPADPAGAPRIDFGLLGDRRDIARLRVALQTVARLFAHPALARHDLRPVASRFAEPALGGPPLDALLADDAALERYLRENVSGVWHASGTCRIGATDDRHAVVDASGRVYGVRGLRVVDASVMPTVPTANTNLPVLMLAEKIADAIKAQR
ncbi:putative oxidoreductase [Burkholderia aenigmatica]|uniref:Putative oxidoreductase n=2 Tax=Burkholderia TaxID=32008 RepID=A0A6J5IRF0_9BURK|nr:MULTISPECIES: GMC oxidoreductase [Burkholderia]CAB3961498.1 putative oxidoreductase [Burkholderia aenigmatica]